MLIKIHLTTPLRVMNPHQRCLQPKAKQMNELQHVKPKSPDLSYRATV